MAIRKWVEMIRRVAMQQVFAVGPELNDSSRRDEGGEHKWEEEERTKSSVFQRGMTTTTTTTVTIAALAEPGEEVGSGFAGERKRLMYDRRRKERSQQSGTTGGVIPG